MRLEPVQALPFDELPLVELLREGVMEEGSRFDRSRER